MSFPQARGRLQTAVFGRLGEAATWNGEPVRARLGEGDEEVGLGDSRLILGGLALRVRRSDVASPGSGDDVRLTDAGRRFQVSGDCRIDANGVWTCPAEEVFD